MIKKLAEGLLLMSSVAAAQEVKPNPQSATAGIQEAIDALGPGGGVVTLKPGEYLLRRSIQIRGPVTLQGGGPKTVLRKSKQAESKLAAAAEPGSTSVRVENATGFRAGDEIGIFDEGSVGWLNAHAVLKGVQGNELLLEGRVPKGYKFDPTKGGGIVNYFSAITSSGVSRIVIKDLTIDGRREENPGPTDTTVRDKDLAFSFAAIHLWNACQSRIEGVHIVGWPGDGISMQTGDGNVVTKCVVENCRVKGYHPGGGLKDSEFSENVARGNGGEGLYFCAGVTRVVVKNNKFVGNGRHGIGGLGDSGDTQNLVENNLCEANGACGIEMVEGEGNTVKNNTCINNSRTAPGRWSGIFLTTTAKSVVSGNRCFDNQKTPTQKHGIEESANCRENVITSNDCRGNAKSGLALKGQEGRRDGNVE